MQKALKKYFANMDEYLASLGLYRKMMARDASCMFRAVSEQLYYSQNYHQKVRQDCVNFIKANRCNFEPFVESFEKYLERLEDPKETAGQVEIKALSLLYRRRFLIYRYPGKPPTEISEDDFVDKVMLCCSNNGHYDIVYPRCYPTDAALCQALVYELLYTQVLGVDEMEIQTALEAFRGGGRRYRNSLSVCSEDAGYDTPEDRAPREDCEVSQPPEDKAKDGVEEPRPAEGPTKLSLPYKVLKALDGDMYRNVEFDVWHDSRKEMQKTDYLVFAGRQYFLGDKCQVRLDPKGKYYNAFIQEVGTQSSAVTVFIEELAEKHLVSLTNLKQVNPVPAWNITPSRKGPYKGDYTRPEQYPGELDSEARGRRRYFKRPRGKEMLMVSYGRPQPGLPPRFQPGPGGMAPCRAPGMHAAPPPPGAVPYEHYHTHPPPPRPHRGYGPPRSSARFVNRHHLIGPEVAYYPHPGKRYYHSYDNYSFRSRRSRRQMHALNKECQFSYPEGEEETQDMEGTITYYDIEEGDDNAFPPLPGQAVPPPMVPVSTPTSYWMQRGPSTLPPQAKQPMTSSEEDPEERSTTGDQGEYSEEYIYSTQDTERYQSPTVYAAAESTANLTIQEGGSRAGSPQEGLATYSYSQQVVVKSAVLSSSQPVNSAPAAIFTSNSSSSSSSCSSQTASGPPSSSHSQGGTMPPHSLGRPVVSMPFVAASPWLVNELGEPVSPVAPPPYSYEANGTDLPRDYKVLQYYFNLGVQCHHHSYWQSVAQLQQVYQPASQDAQYQPYPQPQGPSQAHDHGTAQGYSEPGRSGPHAYPDAGRSGPESQGDGHPNGPALAMDPPQAPAPSAVLYPLYQEQCGQTPLHSYEPYLPVLPSPATYQYLSPWTSIQGPGQHPRIHAAYCPSSAHPVSFITTPSHPSHFIPPSM